MKEDGMCLMLMYADAPFSGQNMEMGMLVFLGPVAGM